MPHKLVVIGAAGHAGVVLGELMRFPQLHFVATAPSFMGEDVSSYLRAPTPHGPPQLYEEWRAMLDAEQPDIVTICGRYDLNAPLALEAVRRKCHVICDKPAAHTMEDLAELRGVVGEMGVQYALMLVMRYEAPYFAARQLVQQGLIGEPYLISAQKAYRWGINRPAFYGLREQYGSTMTWVGIHAFDYACWVAGVRYAEVFAYHANKVHTERPGCQDVATVIANLANGGSAVFNLDYLRPAASPTHGDDRLRIAGSQGVLEVCDEGRRLRVITAERNVESWPLVDPGRSLVSDLLAALEGRGNLLVPAEEAFRITAFAIRAAEAANTHQVLPVTWPW
jgi:predicted dehydrogenase